MQPHVRIGSALIVTCISVNYAARTLKNMLRLVDCVQKLHWKLPVKGKKLGQTRPPPPCKR